MISTYAIEPRLFFELPALPGAVGPATAVAEPPTLEETVALPRLEFTWVLDEPPAPEPCQADDPYAGWTRAQLYARAKEVGLPGRSRLCKARLRQALLERERAAR